MAGNVIREEMGLYQSWDLPGIRAESAHGAGQEEQSREGQSREGSKLCFGPGSRQKAGIEARNCLWCLAGNQNVEPIPTRSKQQIPISPSLQSHPKSRLQTGFQTFPFCLIPPIISQLRESHVDLKTGGKRGKNSFPLSP